MKRNQPEHQADRHVQTNVHATLHSGSVVDGASKDVAGCGQHQHQAQGHRRVGAEHHRPIQRADGVGPDGIDQVLSRKQENDGFTKSQQESDAESDEVAVDRRRQTLFLKRVAVLRRFHTFRKAVA